MSKLRLQKELRTFTREQLIDIILTLYSARKDAKEYFEFFLDPDYDKLLEKHCKIVVKECHRTKYSYSKFRISVVKKAIKDVASFGTPAEMVLKFMLWCISVLVANSTFMYYTPAQEKSILNLAIDTISFANSHDLFSSALSGLTNLIERNKIGTDHIKNVLRQALQ